MTKISTNLGKVATTPKGEYNDSIKYLKLDVVTYNGSSYVSLKESIGNLPTNTEYWQLLASKGEKGESGYTPIKGVDYFTPSDIASLNIPRDTEDLSNNAGFITKDVNDLSNYELKTATGNSIEMSIDSSTYVMTLSLKNSQGTILNTQTVDLPLETMVVGGTYDSTNKKIVLTLKNGNTIDVPVGDLINGLQSEITATNKLDASLVDDSLSTNKFVTPNDKTNWDSKEDTSNKVTSIDNTSTDEQYASAKAIYDLVSGSSGGLNEAQFITSNTMASPFVFAEKKLGIYFVAKNLTTLYAKGKTTDTSAYGSNNVLFFIYSNDINNITGNGNLGVAFYYNSSNSRVQATGITYYNGKVYLGSDSGAARQTSLDFMLKEKDQTFDGVKTFVSLPKVYQYTTPTQNEQLTPKKYVDDSISNAITTTLNGSY
jgi:hypothetical protein